MSDDELALLDSWCAGDAAAGNALFKRHYTAIYRFFANKVDCRSDAEELAQETFLACQRSRDRFRRESSFRTYAFTIARNALYAYWRQRAGRGTPLDFDEISVASLSTSVGSRLTRHDDSRRLVAALRALPLEQQIILELHYWEELDGDRIAEVFEIAPATTRSRLFRAREALREHFEAAAGAGADDDLDAWARALRPDGP